MSGQIAPQLLSALVRCRPAEARRHIVLALVARHGVVVDAAAELGVSARTMARWLVALDLRLYAGARRRAAGLPAGGHSRRLARLREDVRRGGAPEPAATG